MFTLKNEQFEIQVEKNPDRKAYSANSPYRATLVSGTWPDNQTLIAGCDNGKLNAPDISFGGTVSKRSPIVADVVVYID